MTRPRTVPVHQVHEPQRRAAQAVRGLASAALLVVLVVGLPVVLRTVAPVTVPDRLPTWDLLRDSLTRPEDGALLRSVLVVLAWAAWAGFAGCIGLEVVSVIRRRPTPRIPLLRLPQQGAASLVAAVLLLGSTGGGATGAGTPTQAPVPVAASRPAAVAAAVATPTPVPTRRPADRQDTGTDAGAEADRGRHPTVVVRRHDTLWGLAERHLSSGLRYHEIVELNRGRVQPDGRRLTDPHWIYPGWVLRLPADATGPGLARAPSVRAEPVRPHRTEVPAMAKVVDRGPVDAPPVSTPGPRLDPIRPAAGATAAAGLIVAEPDPADIAPLVALGLGAITVAGVVAEISRQRSARQRVRRTGSPLTSFPPQAAAAERMLRSVPSESPTRRVRTAMRLLAVGCASACRPVPKVTMVRVGPEAVSVLLAEDDGRVVAPFEAAGPRCWLWRHDDATGHLAEGSDGVDAPDPCPALVSVGADGPDLVLVNLEAAGTLRVAATPALARPVIDAITVDLTSRARESGVSISQVAPDVADGTAQIGGLAVPTVTDEQAGQVVAARTDEVREVLDAAEVPDVAAARSAGVGEDVWLPHVIVGEQTSVTAPPWSGTAVVTGRAGPGWTLRTEDGERWRLDPAGTALVPQRLDDESVRWLHDLMDPIADDSVVDDEGSYDDQCERVREQLAAIEVTEAAMTAGGPRLLLLGPVEVRGVDDALIPGRVRRATELVAYLALRPGATRHELDEVMWPGRRVTRTTRNQFVSRARLWLGRDDAGAAYLPLVTDEGAYRLLPSVSCDWYDFVRLARRGLAGGAVAVPELTAALALVRGRPFLGVDPASYSWADDVSQQIIAVVVDVAHLLSVAQLVAGSPLDAARAAARGLAVEPASETLHRDAIRAAAARGDAAEVRRAVTRMRQSYEELGLGDDLMPQTLALLQSLGCSD